MWAQVEVFPNWTITDPHDILPIRRVYLYSTIVSLRDTPATSSSRPSKKSGWVSCGAAWNTAAMTSSGARRPLLKLWPTPTTATIREKSSLWSIGVTCLCPHMTCAALEWSRDVNGAPFFSLSLSNDWVKLGARCYFLLNQLVTGLFRLLQHSLALRHETLCLADDSRAFAATKLESDVKPLQPIGLCFPTRIIDHSQSDCVFPHSLHKL